MAMPDPPAGGVNLARCPYRAGKCQCGVCAVCGYHRHMAVHAPRYGMPPGSEPVDHQFQPLPEAAREAARLTAETERLGAGAPSGYRLSPALGSEMLPLQSWSQSPATPSAEAQEGEHG